MMTVGDNIENYQLICHCHVVSSGLNWILI